MEDYSAYTDEELIMRIHNDKNDHGDNNNIILQHFLKLCTITVTLRKKHMPLNTYISFSQSDSDGTEFEEMLQDDIASPEQLLIEKEKFKEFKEQLWNKLSNMEKKVLQLYLEGNNYTSIARMLGKSDKSIDNALSRIRQKLKRK